LLALALRLPQLSRRPMHTDEAVHAFKFGTLLEEKTYRYDPHEYHGPTLNYFSLVPAWLSRQKTYQELSETTLRIVPVFFGVMLVLWALMSSKFFGRRAAAVAALLIAISPAMVFYSRYYIQEMLLVSFTAGFLLFAYFYVLSGKNRWLVTSGISAGLMIATKETFVLSLLALILAIAINGTVWQRKKFSFKPLPAFIFLISAGVVFALFYSSFFTNPAGLLDFFASFQTYLHRSAQQQAHIHPWFYYFRIYGFYHVDGGGYWSEWLVFVGAALGLWAIFTNRIKNGDDTASRVLALYAILLAVIYSAIPYKTPWSFLSAFFAWIILAGIGIAWLLGRCKTHAAKACVLVFIVIGVSHLGYLSWRANFRDETNPANPYVYAQTSKDIFGVTRRVQEIAAATDGTELFIDVICPAGDYWPLPWYLREFYRIGWWNKVEKDIPAAPLILIQPGLENDLVNKLYLQPEPGQRPLYLPLFDSYMELRPGVELRGYIRKDLWDKYQTRTSKNEDRTDQSRFRFFESSVYVCMIAWMHATMHLSMHSRIPDSCSFFNLPKILSGYCSILYFSVSSVRSGFD
jgi:uncharacterized protein (TIGR03663 family)